MDISAELAQMRDPEYRKLQARYDNARVAVANAYNLASKGGVSDLGTFFAKARAIAVEYEKDLNATLSILDVKKELHESVPAELLRPS